MKQSNCCLKCGSNELLRIPGVPGEEPHIAIGAARLHEAEVAKYVCAKCGYIEQWIENPSDLQELESAYGNKS